MKLFYKPKIAFIITDILSIALVFGVVLGWFPLTTQTPFLKYSYLIIVYFFCWLGFSYIFGRYKKNQSFVKSAVRLLVNSLIVFGLMWLLIKVVYDRGNFSPKVLFTVTLGIFTMDYLIMFIYYAYRYAVSYDTPPEVINQTPRENDEERPSETIPESDYQALCDNISSAYGTDVLNFLNKTLDLRDSNVSVLFQHNIDQIKDIENYRYSSFVFLERLNDIRGINLLMYQLNEKLPRDGKVIFRFESKSTRKKIILNKYPKYINYMVYSAYYVVKRLIPHIILTRRLYYDVTKGKKRVLSKAEVLGRLYYSGFEVVSDKKVGDLNYVVARRITYPRSYVSHTYGPLIRLPRVGKNGKKFNVYKLRTMHPYSEYLQPYIFEKNSLQEGGKIKRDIRVTTLGRIMRKYWLDELPMVINLMKGDMKLIGVRPLSQHYFSLYSKELQEERIKTKPGLLPPFYADMPKTLDEIQASEMRYLMACNEKGTFRTDVRYFFLILKNILFKKARSA